MTAFSIVEALIGFVTNFSRIPRGSKKEISEWAELFVSEREWS